jgi:hypothetical protein
MRHVRQLAYCVSGRSQLRLTTSVHLFKTLVRPMLEYGAAVWGPMCSKEELKQLERVQEQFGRRLLHLHPWANREFVRRELGLESLEQRIKMATLRYYVKLTEMPDTRLAGFIFRKRCEQLDHAPRGAEIRKWSWCSAAKGVLDALGCPEIWRKPLPADWSWKDLKASVRESFTSRSDAEMERRPLLELYRQLGPPTVAGWLDSAVQHPGAALRAKLRSGWVPLMDAIGESADMPREQRTCRLCGTGAVESAQHFAAECQFNGLERIDCLERIARLLGDSQSPRLRQAVEDADVSLFLGDRWLIGLPKELAKRVDTTVCDFLTVAWRRRKARWQTFCQDGDEWKPKAY